MRKKLDTIKLRAKMEVKRALVILCCVLLYAITTVDHTNAITSEQESDKITTLPGQPPVNFLQYSGYITVNETRGRALFYWLTETETDPEKVPLALWLNGGPGCSSIAYGASEEIGPFRINKTETSLYLNPYSWNKVANLLFLESPAGVGFSYTNTTEELKTPGDKRTAEDALVFVIRWFERFPQYNNRDFYLIGESYAGHYIPQLAKKIVEYNKANPKSVINFKGLMVGNADMDHHYGQVGIYTYLWTHAVISDHTYDKIMSSCKFSSAIETDVCYKILAYAQNKEMGKIDDYSIYTPSCSLPSHSKYLDWPKRFGNSVFGRVKHSSYDPCSVHYAEVYYNNPEVQKALHANVTRISYKWSACSDLLFDNWTWADNPITTLPILKELMAAGLRIWVYSGDTDSVVPVTATRLSLKSLHLKIKTPWYPWYLDNSVGGWTEVYEGLTFATVRGSGHEVPHIQPERAFSLFKSFLAGENLPAM